MCLYISNTKPRPKKSFKVYKVLKISGNDIVTPNRNKIVKENTPIVAAVKMTAKKIKNISIVNGEGVHAFQSLERAKRSGFYIDSSNSFIVECTVAPNDFLAWGNDGYVVVKKLSFPKGSFDNAKKIQQKILLKNDLTKLEKTKFTVQTYISNATRELANATNTLNQLQMNMTDLTNKINKLNNY